ncbi:MAG: folylpolyglutamate synthase/dihydrofolate synthase family protein [Bacteroidales bacterium]
MNYQQTIGYLYSQLPMFHRIGPPAYKASLDNIVILSQHLGNPHHHFPTIHIAGTNGKGSVAHMMAAILREQGYKTGLATSPHLKDYRERIRINGQMIPRKVVSSFVTRHQDLFEQIKPSFFELTIALTFWYFADRQVDIAVVETGLGGRLDSTNIILPELSIITNIGLDHVNLLGDTLEKIAREKAGIIKEGVPVVIGRRQQQIHHVFEEMAAAKRSPVFVAPDNYQFMKSSEGLTAGQMLQELSYKTAEGEIVVHSDLLGASQPENVATVLQGIDVLNAGGRFSVSEDNVLKALTKVSVATGLKGRWQVLGHNPAIICDTAHNTDGVAMVMERLLTIPFRQLHIVFGMVDDKEIDSVLALMPDFASYYFCKPDVPRGKDAKQLADHAAAFGLNGEVFDSVPQALKQAREAAQPNDLIYVGGSTFVVAEVV